jgi:hypothetical protein
MECCSPVSVLETDGQDDWWKYDGLEISILNTSEMEW